MTLSMHDLICIWSYMEQKHGALLRGASEGYLGRGGHYFQLHDHLSYSSSSGQCNTHDHVNGLVKPSGSQSKTKTKEMKFDITQET